MHTLLNDRYPMHSKMIFSPEPDGSEDGFLKTYEIYGIPFKAKMVVLSSCNSGSGYLHEGEGILSLQGDLPTQEANPRFCQCGK